MSDEPKELEPEEKAPSGPSHTAIPDALVPTAAAIELLAGVPPTLRRDGWLELVIPAERLPDVVGSLRRRADGLDFNHLSSVTAVDRGEDGFDVVYHLISLTDGRQLVIRVRAAGREHPSVPSLAGIWPTVNWQEREVYDLMGIHFEGHPDLRRILMREDWAGHPLRKDYADERPPRERITREAYARGIGE